MNPDEQPAPAFKAFFAGDWQRLLETVVIPGWQEPVSWDRKAAYIVWTLGQHYDGETPLHWRDIFKAKASTAVIDGTARQLVGTPAPVNSAQEWPSLPTSEGVQLAFNSADW